MEPCYYCGRLTSKIRTYDGIRMHVCYDCTFARARRKADESKKRHRKGDRVKAKLISKFGAVCQECGIEPREIHAHHKKRIMDGGTNTEDNMVLLCPDCHKEAHKNGTRW